ncbi:hypothetical protein UPYG_G00214710 [Umbra pygmaea]|uniref:Ig-like domain-containing protein n=1 Tax=Umbra pygmaea TaxID=75934 RepID=A0ABD0X2L8_UMBPY
MEVVLGVFAILAGFLEGLENFCYFNQNETECYGPLGGNVYLHLSCDAKDYNEFTLTKDNEKHIVRMKLNKTIIDESLRNRTQFFVNNVTFMIQYTEMNDSAVYKLEMFKNGSSQCIRDLRLSIEAPVSSPQLTSECLDGTVRVSCSSQGDNVQFTWTLNGHTVPDTDGTVGNETNIITLRKGLSGCLRCDVRNNVSNKHKSTEIKPFPGFRLADCTLNGTKIFKWVDTTDNSLCVDPTFVPLATVTEASSVRNDLDQQDSCHRCSALWINIIYVKCAEIFILLAVCLGSYWFYRRKTVGSRASEVSSVDHVWN